MSEEADLILRDATNSDSDDIRSLVFGILAEVGLNPDPSGVDSDLDDLAASYVAPGGGFWVLRDEEANRLVGCIGLMPAGPGVLELRKMYLDSAYRGRGLGKLLLEHALAFARQAGAGTVELETESRLDTAIQLYQRYGFQEVAADHVCSRCDRKFALEIGGE
jgi:putative acetyltransferase